MTLVNSIRMLVPLPRAGKHPSLRTTLGRTSCHRCMFWVSLMIRVGSPMKATVRERHCAHPLCPIYTVWTDKCEYHVGARTSDPRRSVIVMGLSKSHLRGILEFTTQHYWRVSRRCKHRAGFPAEACICMVEFANLSQRTRNCSPMPKLPYIAAMWNLGRVSVEDPV